MKEKNNFASAVKWLRDHGKIKNQKDLAMRIGVTETTITRNKKGNVSRPDDETLHKFNDVFGDIINIAYLREESSVMLVEELQRRQEINTSVNSESPTPPDALTAALLAAKDETIASKEETIAALRNQLSDKDDVIAAKDALISSLQQQLDTLHAQLTIEKGPLTDGVSLSEIAKQALSRV